jgi:hypothetical protein
MTIKSVLPITLAALLAMGAVAATAQESSDAPRPTQQEQPTTPDADTSD